MIKRSMQWLVERFWVRIGLAVALLLVGMGLVGAPILSDNSLRQALASGASPSPAPAYAFRYSNQPDGTAQIQRSAGSDQNWVKVAALPEPVEQLAAAGRRGEQLVYARSADAIWRSEDAGATWAKAKALPGKPLSMAVAQNTGDTLLAGTADTGLYISTDRGQSWRTAGGSLALAGPGSLAVPAVAFNPNDESIIYATAELTIATPQGSHSAQQVFVSPDGGSRWFQMQAGDMQGTPAATPAGSGQILPTAGRPLAITLTGKSGSQAFEVANATGVASGLGDPDPVTRAATARLLGLTGDRSQAAVLMQHLRDDDPAVGQQVAQAIGRLGDPGVAPGLMQALKDSSEDVRARAALALGLLKYEPAVSTLAAMLQNDGPLARTSAADALGAIGSKAAVAALLPGLGEAELTGRRQVSMQALEASGQRAVPQLAEALQDNSTATRRNAAEVLGWIASPEAVSGLSQALADQDPTVRTEAAWALGQIGTAPAQQALAHSMSVTGDQATREAATQALTQAQRSHSERAAVAETPLGAFMNALTQIPASRWTLLFLVVVLAAILLTVHPQRPAQQRRSA